MEYMQCIECGKIVKYAEHNMMKKIRAEFEHQHKPFVEELKMKLPKPSLRAKAATVDSFGNAIICMSCLIRYMNGVYEGEI